MMVGKACGCEGALSSTGAMINDAGGGGPMDGAVSLDLSRPVWKTGQNTTVSDLLWAVPFVKGKPTLGVTAGSYSMAVQVQRAGASISTPSYYGLQTPITNVADPSPTTESFTLFRIGGRVRVLTIDQFATAAGTAQNYATDQLQVAALSSLRYLDNQLIAGVGGGIAITGLSKLATQYGQTSSLSNADTAARQIVEHVHCNGAGGTGEGLDCYFAGIRTIRTLMSTSAGQTGASGWRRDTRTGRFVFHYQGIPVYRVDSADVETGTLWGANLGSTGISIVHAFGSADGFGLVAEETPVTDITGTKDIMVHGAWTLVAWEPTALYEVNGITLIA